MLYAVIHMLTKLSNVVKTWLKYKYKHLHMFLFEGGSGNGANSKESVGHYKKKA
jgi:hypothetical protein